MAKVSVGPSSVAGGAVTVAAYAAAVVAFAKGARDEATISAVVVGTVALVTTLGGRFAQAVAQVLQGWRNVALAPAPSAQWTEQPGNATTSRVEWHGTAGSAPRPMVSGNFGEAKQNKVEPLDLPMFDPDGEPRDHRDLVASLPEESFIADPKDKDGAKDQRVVGTGPDGNPVVS